MSESRAAQLSAGQVIGNYVLSERVGAGAFAEVWKANHVERPGVVVAIKIATNPAFARQLSREGRLPAIEHPNFVRILDSNTRGLNDPPYVVMPFYASGSLADLIRRHSNGLDEKRAEAILRGIVAGLAASHARGIIHRDVKPSNILMGDGDQPVIGDFGLSVGHAAADVQRSVDQSMSIGGDRGGGLTGSLPYMAPEVRNGGEPTAASDVYAVGLITFEMLVGRRPDGDDDLPSHHRSGLKRPLWWDSVSYNARRRFADRPADAVKLAEGLDGRLPPPPAAVAAAPVAIPPPPQIAPLPDDLWDGLLLRWRECQQARAAAAQQRQRTEDSARKYEDDHPEVQAHRAADGELQARIEQCDSRFATVRRTIDARLAQDCEVLGRAKVDRLSARFRPEHPEVLAISSQLAKLQSLRGLVSSDSGTREIVDCLEDWARTAQASNSAAYRDFTKRYAGKPYLNPRAAAAEEQQAHFQRAEEQRAAQERRRKRRTAVVAATWRVCGWTLLFGVIGAALGAALGWACGLYDTGAEGSEALSRIFMYILGALGLPMYIIGAIPMGLAGYCIGWVIGWVLGALPGGPLSWALVVGSGLAITGLVLFTREEREKLPSL